MFHKISTEELLKIYIGYGLDDFIDIKREIQYEGFGQKKSIKNNEKLDLKSKTSIFEDFFKIESARSLFRIYFTMSSKKALKDLDRNLDENIESFKNDVDLKNAVSDYMKLELKTLMKECIYEINFSHLTFRELWDTCLVILNKGYSNKYPTKKLSKGKGRAGVGKEKARIGKEKKKEQSFHREKVVKEKQDVREELLEKKKIKREKIKIDRIKSQIINYLSLPVTKNEYLSKLNNETLLFHEEYRKTYGMNVSVSFPQITTKIFINRMYKILLTLADDKKFMMLEKSPVSFHNIETYTFIEKTISEWKSKDIIESCIRMIKNYNDIGMNKNKQISENMIEQLHSLIKSDKMGASNAIRFFMIYALGQTYNEYANTKARMSENIYENKFYLNIFGFLIFNYINGKNGENTEFIMNSIPKSLYTNIEKYTEKQYGLLNQLFLKNENVDKILKNFNGEQKNQDLITLRNLLMKHVGNYKTKGEKKRLEFFMEPYYNDILFIRELNDAINEIKWNSTSNNTSMDTTEDAIPSEMLSKASNKKKFEKDYSKKSTKRQYKKLKVLILLYLTLIKN